MNYNTIKDIMEGGEHLYTMLTMLCEGIADLPSCKMTAGLKELAADVRILGLGVYETMHLIATDTGSDCKECLDAEYSNKYDDPEADVPESTDVREFLEQVTVMLASGRPFTVSADIYLSSGEPDSEGDA